jgi:hypothetical protein
MDSKTASGAAVLVPGSRRQDRAGPNRPVLPACPAGAGIGGQEQGSPCVVFSGACGLR